jgi:hypothetical protein
MLCTLASQRKALSKNLKCCKTLNHFISRPSFKQSCHTISTSMQSTSSSSSSSCCSV